MFKSANRKTLSFWISWSSQRFCSFYSFNCTTFSFNFLGVSFFSFVLSFHFLYSTLLSRANFTFFTHVTAKQVYLVRSRRFIVSKILEEQVFQTEKYSSILFRGAVIALEFASSCDDLCQIVQEEVSSGDFGSEEEIYVSPPHPDSVRDQIEHIFNASNWREALSKSQHTQISKLHSLLSSLDLLLAKHTHSLVICIQFAF